MADEGMSKSAKRKAAKKARDAAAAEPEKHPEPEVKKTDPGLKAKAKAESTPPATTNDFSFMFAGDGGSSSSRRGPGPWEDCYIFPLQLVEADLKVSSDVDSTIFEKILNREPIVPDASYRIVTVDGDELEVDGWSLLTAGFKFKDEVSFSDERNDEVDTSGEAEGPSTASLRPDFACTAGGALAPEVQAPDASEGLAIPGSFTQRDASQSPTTAGTTVVQVPVSPESGGQHLSKGKGPPASDDDSDSSQALSLRGTPASLKDLAGGKKRNRRKLRKKNKAPTCEGAHGSSSLILCDGAPSEVEGSPLMHFTFTDQDLALYNPFVLKVFSTGKALIAPMFGGAQPSNAPPAAGEILDAAVVRADGWWQLSKSMYQDRGAN